MSVFLPQTLLENTAMSAPFCQDIAEFKAKLKAEIRGRPWIMSSWAAVATISFIWIPWKIGWWNLTSRKIILIFIIFIFERPTCKLRKEEAKKMEFVIWCWVVFSLNPLGPSLNV